MFWAEIWKISVFFIWKFSVFGHEIFYLFEKVCFYSLSVCLLPVDMSKIAGWVTNSVDHSQTPRSVLSLNHLLVNTIRVTAVQNRTERFYLGVGRTDNRLIVLLDGWGILLNIGTLTNNKLSIILGSDNINVIKSSAKICSDILDRRRQLIFKQHSTSTFDALDLFLFYFFYFLHNVYILLNALIISGYLVSHSSVQNGSNIFLYWFIHV